MTFPMRPHKDSVLLPVTASSIKCNESFGNFMLLKVDPSTKMCVCVCLLMSGVVLRALSTCLEETIVTGYRVFYLYFLVPHQRDMESLSEMKMMQLAKMIFRSENILMHTLQLKIFLSIFSLRFAPIYHWRPKILRHLFSLLQK